MVKCASDRCLGHTYASLLLQYGVSPAYVQEQLGRGSIKLTVDSYGRWLRKTVPGAVDRLDEAPGPESDSNVVANGSPARSRHCKLLWGLVDRGGSNPRPPDCEVDRGGV